ncbi:MAG: cytochrome C [Symploca sp. SIO1C4]|uniref:Cytochrome C n=1 Tax=Symploca sp. SIO1C4 TaxID=2607765 RepID=A0A6B3N4P7_9CYAN|nr:cytochrome C [Symploca sp. SIO1C4]
MPTVNSRQASPLLSFKLPYDVDLSNSNTLETRQHDFDVFSWQSFIALNWPTLPNESVNTRELIGSKGDNATVWEAYKEAYQVFLPDGKTPPFWGQTGKLPRACQNLKTSRKFVFRMSQKVANEVLDADEQVFNTGPLIDQQGQYVRYAIHFNDRIFDYILNNNLYSKQGQDNFDAEVNFPSGNNDNQEVGAIILKSAWKVLDPQQDDASRFHKIKALVYTPASAEPLVKESCQLKTMGMVGLHIARKTKSAPQWVWSTFEHVDNLEVPPNSGLKPLFFNPESKVPENQPPPKPWNPNLPAQPSQVTRVIPIDQATKNLNSQWQAKLRQVNEQSVWQYYQLVSTQWPANPTRSAAGDPAPQFLANITMETYIQGRVPNVSSSCVLCHINSTMTNGKFSDFTYLLERAK